MKLENATALVTGGAVRIGRAICEALARSGCNVVVHYHTSRDDAMELVDRLGGFGVLAVPVWAELGTEAAAEALIADAWAKAGRLDILVNSAAVFHKDALPSAGEEKLLHELQVNALAPIYLTRAFAARLRRDVSGCGVVGRIINLLDRRITRHEPDCLPYLLSKKMLAAFTCAAALELAPHVTVNAVAPGAILPPPGETDDYIRERAGSIPLCTAGTPEDIAQASLFLLCSDVITGQTVFVDGGQHLL